MGKERFLPLQMRLTKVLFNFLAVSLPLMFAAALLHHEGALWGRLAAGLAVVAALVAALVVFPKALRAGGAALRRVRQEGAGDTVAEFASDGGGGETRWLHRTVVALVVVMLLGLGVHGVALLTAGHGAGLLESTAHAQHTSPDHKGSHAEGHGKDARPGHEAKGHKLTLNGTERWKANPETTAGVQSMKKIVSAALSGPLDASHTKKTSGALHAAFLTVFRECTMTGSAHEQLHSYLAPMAGLIEKLGTSTGPDAHAILERLSEHLASYDKWFQ
jgi:hypothetical protein